MYTCSKKRSTTDQPTNRLMDIIKEKTAVVWRFITAAATAAAAVRTLIT